MYGLEAAASGSRLMVWPEQKSLCRIVDSVVKVYGARDLVLYLSAEIMAVPRACIIWANHQHFVRFGKIEGFGEQALSGLVEAFTWQVLGSESNITGKDAMCCATLVFSAEMDGFMPYAMSIFAVRRLDCHLSSHFLSTCRIFPSYYYDFLHFKTFSVLPCTVVLLCGRHLAKYLTKRCWRWSVGWYSQCDAIDSWALQRVLWSVYCL